MKTPRSGKATLLRAAICLLLSSPLALAQNTTGTDEALEQLLQQADFWQENQRPDLVREILERYLRSQPDNPEVLYRLAVQALQEGRADDAQRWTLRLIQVSPDDPRLDELQQAQLEQGLNAGDLAHIRRLARDGQIDAALAGYRQLFQDSTPPRNLAPEYYQTLAGTEAGWPQAREALQGLHAAEPNDRQIARALAEVLTYREITRRDGIDRLALLATETDNQRPSPAISAAWRQALVWLNATMADRGRYDAYRALHPNDSSINQVFEERVVPGERALAYRQLDAGRLDRAEASFRNVLALKARDAEALAGLGIVMLRRERFAESARYLGQAIELLPSQADQWREAYRSASFYARLAELQRRAAAGEREAVLVDLAPLVRESGEDGRAAGLLQASILRDLNYLDRAEDAYRQILQGDSGNTEAKLGLVEVLRLQGRWMEAVNLAEQLPASERQRLNALSQATAQGLRSRAASELPAEAEVTLRQALALAGDDPWVRYDLALLLKKQGRESEARTIVRPLETNAASAEGLYVAALLAAEQERWSDVQSLIDRIPVQERSPAMMELSRSSSQRQELARAIEQWRRGHTNAARTTLGNLRTPNLTPRLSGQIALALSDAGMQSEALYWVHQDLAAGIEESPIDYANHILVLGRAGQLAEAEAVLEQLQADSRLAPKDRLALAELNYGLTVLRADQLREVGQLADAYSLLAEQLLVAPENEQLLAAMARLYGADGRNRQADEIYSYILRRNPDDEELLQQSVESALAAGNIRRARQLLAQLEKRNDQEPSVLFLSARVAHASDDDRRALALLADARKKLKGDAPSWQQAEAANPFRNTNSNSPLDRPSWLPGGQAQAEISTSDPTSSSPSLESRITQLDNEIRRQRPREHQFATTMQMRSGEKGLSQLHHLSADLSFAGYLGNSRLGLKIIPAAVDSGTPRSDAMWRFGYGGLATGPAELNLALNGFGEILDGIESMAQNYFDARDRADLALTDPNLPSSEQQRLVAEADAAERQLERNLDRDPVYEAGLRLAELTQQQQQRLKTIFGPAIGDLSSLQLDASSRGDFATSRAAMEAAMADLHGALSARSPTAMADSQRDAGLGLQLSYEFDDLLLDIGTTPLGFEESNVVGGAGWTPSFGNFGLSAQVERRGVSESVLSYAGTRDPVTDEVWGGVVKTGLVLGLHFDSPSIGVYSELSGHRYTGENVASNNGYQLAVGAYTRPIQTEAHLLELGVHIQGMSFDKNLGYFSYGHGGYFSPEDYLSIAYPLNYQGHHGRWQVSANLTPGYQTFSRDRVAYFPTDEASQALLDIYSALNVIPSSYYEADDESGLGLSLGGKAEYQITRNLSAGFRTGYSNFGGYEDYHVSLYFVSRISK